MSQRNASHAYGFLSGLGLGLVTSAATIWAWTRYQKVRDPPRTAVASHSSVANRPLNISDHVVREHLSRNLLFFGDDGSKAVANSRVVVVGLGGVGSHAAHMLLRAGIGHMRLVDFDQVQLAYMLLCQNFEGQRRLFWSQLKTA